MKLLHVISSLDPTTGGIVSALEALNVALEDAGHEVDMVCLDHPDAAWLDGYRKRPTALGKGSGSYQYHPQLHPVLIRRVASFDACIVHGLWQYPGLAARAAALKCGKPYFVFPHGMLDPWFKRAHPLKHLKKWLYWPWGEYRVLRDAAAVLFTCEEEMTLARKSFPQLYSAREAVVGLGLRDIPRDTDELKEEFLTAYPTLKGKTMLLFLGRLHPKKGLDLLIRAFGRICPEDPTLHLVIAGAVSGTDVGPNYLANLAQLAEETCPLHSVSFCGMLEGRQKWAALCAADAFALTSHQENFGMAVVEALSCGTPVLISDKVNIWREIEKEGGGLVAPDTVEGSTQLLKRWLTLQNSDRIRLKERARMCFESNFAIERVGELLVDIIRGYIKREMTTVTA